MSDDFCSHGRDRPLGFHHRIGRAVLDSLGLPKPKNEHREIARASILAEAILADDEGKTVSYSRRRQSYTGRQRYMGPAYTYANVISEIDVLGPAGLLEEQRAKSGSRDWQSTFRATPALLSVCSSSGYGDFSFQLHDPIKLAIKGSDGRRYLIAYRDTAATRAMRREIEGINADYSGLVLDLPSVEKTDHHWIVEKSTIRPTPLILYRVFNRGSWVCGGRAYAYWQQLPKCFRAQLLINGEPVAEPDYRGLHAALIYAERGMRLVGDDPYEIDGFERGQSKLAFLIAVNSKSTRDAIGSLVRRHGMDRAAATNIIAAIMAKHNRVSDAFCSDAGIRLMRQDSDLILASTRACLNAGIAALPVHDSLIVPLRCEQTAAAILVENFERRYPTASPCRVTTNA
jgi:hypothetical protein